MQIRWQTRKLGIREQVDHLRQGELQEVRSCGCLHMEATMPKQVQLLLLKTAVLQRRTPLRHVFAPHCCQANQRGSQPAEIA